MLSLRFLPMPPNGATVTGMWAKLREMPAGDCSCFAISCIFSDNSYLCRRHYENMEKPDSDEENSLRETLIKFIDSHFEHHAAPTCAQFHTQLVRTGGSCDSVSPNRVDSSCPSYWPSSGNVEVHGFYLFLSFFLCFCFHSLIVFTVDLVGCQSSARQHAARGCPKLQNVVQSLLFFCIFKPPPPLFLLWTCKGNPYTLQIPLPQHSPRIQSSRV